MRDLEFLTDHVIFKLRFNQIYQLKTTLDGLHGKDSNATSENILSPYGSTTSSGGSSG